MSNYHLGEEINKERIRKGMTIDGFADAICRSHSTVYDIFKKNHIATDLLASVCRALGRDFFSELSRANFNHAEMPEEEDEAEIKEMISGLMPEDRLHTLSPGYLLRDVIEEFLSRERTKPLVIFYTPFKKRRPEDSLPTRIQRMAGRFSGDKKMAQALCNPVATDEGFPHICRYGDFISLVLMDNNYANAIKMAERMNRIKSRHVILYIPIKNRLRPGVNGGIVYEDIADDLFDAWQGRAHFIYFGNTGKGIMHRELYMAYRRRGTIDRLIDSLSKDDDIGLTLYDLIFGRAILDVEEINPEDSTGLSRIRIFYRDSDNLNEKGRRLMFENGVNDQPRLSMWLDIRNGCLVDFQYNERTQPSQSTKK